MKKERKKVLKFSEELDKVTTDYFKVYACFKEAQDVLKDLEVRKTIVEEYTKKLEDFITDFDEPESLLFLKIYRDGKTNKEIATETHYSIDYVKHVRMDFKRKIRGWKIRRAIYERKNK